MQGRTLSRLLTCLRLAARSTQAETLTDAELLRRWVHQRDEAAFELLVWRHGRLVLSVCQRVLTHPEDIEDAFQATFLVLVRKASSISASQAVAAWLHTVAYRIALDARARSQRSSTLSPDQALLLPATDPGTPDFDLWQVLDEEVHRLPEAYRAPFILCYLQGRTNEEAARELGRPVGTILSRLSRARERLRQRLTRRGLAPSAALIGPQLASHFLGIPSSPLFNSTIKIALVVAASRVPVGVVSASVAALMKGAIHSMFVAKFKTLSAVVLSVAVVGVGGFTGYRSLSAQEGSATGEPSVRTTASSSQRQLLEDKLKQLRQALEVTNAQREIYQRQLESVTQTLNKLQELERTKAAVDQERGVASRAASTTQNAQMQASEDINRVDVAKFRVRVKQAELDAVKIVAAEAQRRFQAIEKSRATVRGSISDDDLDAARMNWERCKADLRVKEAELEEAVFLLQHAERHAKSSANPVSLEQRVKLLETRLEQMQREIDLLRKQRSTNP